MKKSDISYREAFALAWRGLRIWFKQHPMMLYSAAADLGIKAAAPYVTIWFSAEIINELSGARDPNRLWKLVLLTLGITAAAALLGALAKRWHNYEASTMSCRLSRMHTEKLLSMDFAVLDRYETYDLLTQIQNNASWGGWGMHSVYDQFEKFIEAFVRIGGAVALSASLFTAEIPRRGDWLDALSNPFAALAAIALLVGLVLLSAWFSGKAGRIWASFGKTAVLSNRIFSFFGFTVVKDRRRALDCRMYEQEKMCAKHFIMHQEDVFAWDTAVGKAWRGPFAGLNGLAAAADKAFTGAIYAFVCLKAWAGAFGVGSVTRYIGAITAFSQGMRMLMETISDIRNNAAYLKSTFEFLDMPNVMYQGSLTTEKRSDRQYQVEFRDVSFKYPGSDAWALRHVNMKFEIGRRLAVVGENGSGKTTFIKLLCRLYDPTEGEILLNGIDIKKYDYEEYLAIFSVVFQDFQLLAFTLGENVAAAKEYDEARAIDCLEKAGFGDRLKTLPDGLKTRLYQEYFEEKGVDVSGGEAQKIAIARALYQDAPFIILDEPTAALDPIAEAEVYSKFDEIAGDKTAIYISHRLSSCRFCDDILVFDKGRVIEQGSHDALVANESGKYHALWHAQAQYYTKSSSEASATQEGF